ncbi:MAG: hypothetical protein AAB074_00575 [Planctomycetota bacterium]
MPKLAPTPRLEARLPKAELQVTLRLDSPPAVAPASTPETRILRRPTQDTPTELITRMTMDERRRRLLEMMLEVEAKLEMLDDPVPF